MDARYPAAVKGWNEWLQRFLATAQLEAVRWGHELVDGRHLVLAATHAHSGTMPILESAGVDAARLRRLTARVGPPPAKEPDARAAPLTLADDAKAVIEMAADEARVARQDVGPAHVLVGLAKVHVAFGSFGVYTNDIRRAARLTVPDPAPPPVIQVRAPLRRGRLVIDGGGDTAKRVDAVLALVRQSTREPTIAFVGAACPWSGPPHALRRATEKAGGRLVDVGPSGSTKSSEIVADADVVHLAGGYYRYLVDHLAAGPIGEALVQASDAGAVVWGASAGAIALGVGGVDVSGDDGPEVYPGLAWLDAAVFPHFQGRWEDVEAHLPARLNEQDQGQDVKLLERRPLVRERIAVRVPVTAMASQLLAVPHEGALVADPGWQRFSVLPPFSDDVGAWWWNAERGRTRVV